ncbi:hypothetical protein QE250_01460 [Chromatiaceae bacterium AAb-1]|nr:hypothetical protein [Chromatiaceae bacterium AAb-1]
MLNTELNQLMQAATNDAITYAAEEHRITLDNSLSSLSRLDTILSELHQREKQQKHSDELIFTLCNIFGAYVGTLFINSLGGEWRHNAEQSVPSVYVQYADKEFPFASICYHKIVTDNTISLTDYVTQAMTNAMQ